jgi:hypothetical protein
MTLLIGWSTGILIRWHTGSRDNPRTKPGEALACLVRPDASHERACDHQAEKLLMGDAEESERVAGLLRHHLKLISESRLARFCQEDR